MALSTQELDEALALARRVVGEATALLREVGQGDVGRVSSKSNVRDLVTEWDTRIEDLLTDRLTRATPDIPLLAEERGGTAGAGAERRWLIDPIDGTVNFSHGIPIYGVTVALEEAGRPVVGVVAAPALGWESWARRGGGAFDEQGRPMAVSGITELERAILSTGFPYDRATTGTNFAEWEHFQRRAGACRRLGAASLDLCMVARGQLDGYWETRLQPWDLAAGALLVEEAGGVVTGITGEAFSSDAGNAVASNGAIHQRMLDELAVVRSRSRTS